MADAEIRVRFGSSGATTTLRDLRRIKRDLNEFNEANRLSAELSAETNDRTNRLGGSVTNLAAKYFLVTQAIQGLIAVARPAYNLLIGQNATLEDQLLAIQSTLAATNRVIVDGVEVINPADAIQSLEQPVNDAIARIREGSLELVGVTSGQLIETFRITAQEAGAIGASIEDASDLALDFASALGALNIPLNQQREEISSLFRGTITPRNSRLGSTLTITNAEIKRLRETGGLVERLNEELEIFREANSLQSSNLRGVTSNIAEELENLSRITGEPLLDSLKVQFNSLFEFLRDNRDTILDFVTRGRDELLRLFDIIREGGENIARTLAPAFAGLADVFDDDLINALDVLARNLVEIAEIAAKSVAPVFTLVARVVTTAADGLTRLIAAIDILNGRYAQGTETAERFRRSSAAVAQQAIDAARATIQGQEGAAQARQQALAAIDAEIAKLKDANIAGVENRDVVRGMVRELETRRDSLERTGSTTTLVTKSTEQLTAAVKDQADSFKELSQSLEIERLRELADIQESLESGDITPRERSIQLINAEIDATEESIAANRERLAVIQSQADVEDERTQKSLDTERINLEKKIAGDRAKLIQQRNQLEQQSFEIIADSVKAANEVIEQSEAEFAVALAQSARDRTSTEQQQQRFRITQALFTNAELLRIEERRIQDLEALELTGEEEEERQQQIRQARLTTFNLTEERLRQQADLERTLVEEYQQLIEDSADTIRDTNTEVTRSLQREIEFRERITDAIDRTIALENARAGLASAQRTLAETRGQVEINDLERALEIRKRINDEATDPRVRQVLRAQLQSLESPELRRLASDRFNSERELVRFRVEAEERIAQTQKAAFEANLLQEQQAQEAAIARQRIEAQILALRAQQAEIAARSSATDARQKLEQLRADPEADPADIARAQNAVDEADSLLASARQQVVATREQIAEQEVIAELSRSTLDAKQEAAIAEFESVNIAAEHARQLSLVEAKAISIRDAIQATVNASREFNVEIPDAPPPQSETPISRQQIGAIASGAQPLTLPQMNDLLVATRQQTEAIKVFGAAVAASGNRQPFIENNLNITPEVRADVLEALDL